MPAISLDEAWEKLETSIAQRDVESVELAHAWDRICRQLIVSPQEIPLFDKSAMDGFAICGDDLKDGTITARLNAITMAGESPAERLQPGTTVKVMTGAPLPRGADAVVIRERAQVHIADADGTIYVSLDLKDVSQGSNLIRQGSLIRRGETILVPGRNITASRIGLLAELGISRVTVSKRPSVAILATGNELKGLGEVLRPGEIRNSNGPMLKALVRQMKQFEEITDLGVARDTADELQTKITQGLKADVLILSGGVSVGDLDLVPATLEAAGVKKIFHGVQIKPGKPIFFGIHPRGTIVFALPGNPVSTFACFHLFVRPALTCLQGIAWRDAYFKKFILTEDFEGSADRLTFWPGIVRPGTLEEVQLLGWRGSSDLRTLANADAMVRIPVGESKLLRGSTQSGMLINGSI
jgi:molybdopterin molybdotransferase